MQQTYILEIEVEQYLQIEMLFVMRYHTKAKMFQTLAGSNSLLLDDVSLALTVK
jgi:hypothetical protein